MRRHTFALLASLSLLVCSAWVIGCQTTTEPPSQASTDKLERPRYLIPEVEPVTASETPVGTPAAPAAGTPAAPATGTETPGGAPAAPAAPAEGTPAPAAPAAPAPAAEANK